MVTETFGYDGGRQVTVYVPPDPPEAVVFAGDGQLISSWGGSITALTTIRQVVSTGPDGDPPRRNRAGARFVPTSSH